MGYQPTFPAKELFKEGRSVFYSHKCGQHGHAGGSQRRSPELPVLCCLLQSADKLSVINTHGC